MPEFSSGGSDNINGKILVVYGSYSGSTSETAVYIGKKLAENGFETDVRPVEKAGSPVAYDAVILGSGIMMGKMKGSAVKYAQKYSSVILKKKSAAFLVCLTAREETPEKMKTAASYLDPVRPLINPAMEAYFPGRVQFSKLPFPYSLVTLLPAFKKEVPEGDWRDWQKVEKWTGSMVQALKK